MENKLDILTKKLYDEGVEKARKEAEEMIRKANEEAAKIVAAAETKAGSIVDAGKKEAESLKKKAESEMALSARQAITALKQHITDLVSGKVAAEIAKTGFEDKAFVQELLMTIVKKWDIASGSMDVELLLPEEEKKNFSAFVAEKYKDLLDKGLEIKSASLKEAFVLQPRDGGYKITFSEELFETFFGQYMRSLTKELLYR